MYVSQLLRKMFMYKNKSWPCFSLTQNFQQEITLFSLNRSMKNKQKGSLHEKYIPHPFRNKNKDKTKQNSTKYTLNCRVFTRKKAAEICSNLNLTGQLQDDPFFCVVYVLHEELKKIQQFIELRVFNFRFGHFVSPLLDNF